MYYIVGSRGGYGDNKGGNNNKDGNLYGHRCFELLGREDEKKGELAVAETTDEGKHGGGNVSRLN